MKYKMWLPKIHRSTQFNALWLVCAGFFLLVLHLPNHFELSNDCVFNEPVANLNDAWKSTIYSICIYIWFSYALNFPFAFILYSNIITIHDESLFHVLMFCSSFRPYFLHSELKLKPNKNSVSCDRNCEICALFLFCALFSEVKMFCYNKFLHQINQMVRCRQKPSNLSENHSF